ncbi:MAG: hypothetical protein K0M50_06630 [Prolixibacteraceae bacterium]|nr:hypothetical protein [Prolixibacteraceae bacterium]
MKYKILTSIFPYQENIEQGCTPFSISSLPALIDTLKKKCQLKKEHGSIIFHRSKEKKILLTAFREGIKLDSFQSNDSMTFQILEGKIMFHMPKQSLSLEKGQFLKLIQNVPYSFSTCEDTLLLLTITIRKNTNSSANLPSFQDQNYGKQYEFN